MFDLNFSDFFKKKNDKMDYLKLTFLDSFGFIVK